MQDIRDGYYCPDVADLIEACGERFVRLWVSTSIWTAESDEPLLLARGDSGEEAMAKLLRSCSTGPKQPRQCQAPP